MKLSVDLMNSTQLKNSMKPMNSIHSKNIFTPAGPARRAFLLLCVFLMSIGSAWGATLTKGTPSNSIEADLIINEGKMTISGAYFKSVLGSYPIYVRFSAYNVSNEAIEITNVSSEYRSYKSFGVTGFVYTGGYEQVVWDDSGIVTVTLPDGVNKLECYALTSGQYVGDGDFTEPDGGTLISYTLPAQDTFESTLKTGGTKSIYLKAHDNTETSSVAVDFSQAVNALGSTPTYARFILKKQGEIVDPTDLLTISGASPAAQTTSKPKQGFYLYNSGNALTTSGITVTLNSADYADYQVVCMLSADAATATENVVTTEPEWDLEYTYAFEKVQTLPTTSLSQAYAQLNIHSDVLTYFGKSEDEMKDSWYGRWYVRTKEGGAIQPLAFGAAQVADTWSAYTCYNNSAYEEGAWIGNTLSDNYITNNSATTLLYGATALDRIQKTLGLIQIYAPSAYSSLQAASDYEIVYEITDDYTSGTPTMKMRYVFQIPSFENEPNTGMTAEDKPQTISDRAAESFTLGDMPSDAKYARFYLMDKDDNIITPSTILSVANGTTCSKAESGIYLYNSGNVLSPSVSIAAPNAYKSYKVVGLFSTGLTDITADGSTVIQEPKWDMKYTYTFDYTITTEAYAEDIEWNATAMAADASETDIDTKWHSSLDELSAGQCIKWYVTDGAETPATQALAKGTARTAETWTINLGDDFTIAENVATLSGQTTVTAELLAAWVTTNIYAPAGATYADVANHKIICEIYTNNAGTGNPNARYTFSLHKDFPGSLKSSGSSETTRVNPASGDNTSTINAVLPEGTKYARFYLTDADGTAVDPTGKLTIDGGTAVLSTVDGYNVNLGVYLYSNEGLTSPATVTLTLTDATLDQYKVVMVTSADVAVTDGDGNVTSEPDWDKKTTYWFKYSVASWSPEANVEWSAQSMTLTSPNIEGQLGEGYLANHASHYTMQWYVVNKSGEVQSLTTGTNRANGTWSIKVNGNPFTIDSNVASITNNDNLSTTTWATWTAPTFYAPKDKTMRQIAEEGIKFVCKFYEDDQSPLTETLCAMTYTVYIDKTEKMGKLKDGGKTGSTTISDGLTSETTELALDLSLATTAYANAIGGSPRYARIYLEESDGTLVDPSAALTGVGGTAFTNPENGYWLYNNEGITLPTASLKLTAGKYGFYHVVVCLSGDADEQDHIDNSLTRSRAATVTSPYEPDYDYIYTIKFADVSTFPGTVSSSAFTHSNEILIADENATSATVDLASNYQKILSEYGRTTENLTSSDFHIRWYVVKKNSGTGEYERIDNSETCLTPISEGTKKVKEGYGWYWNTLTDFNNMGQAGGTSISGAASTYMAPANNFFNFTFTKPSGEWSDYKVVVVMSDDNTGASYDHTVTKDQYNNVSSDIYYLESEPTSLNMVYTFSFFVEGEFQFTHYRGEAYNVSNNKTTRDYITSSDDSRLAATVQQYSWENDNSDKTAVDGDIRQGVHTVEYEIYVDPNSTTPVALNLPFFAYSGTGSNLEPMAYIRWYDWTTDMNNDRLRQEDVGSKIETSNTGAIERGWFLLNNSDNSIQPNLGNVGVKFYPKDLTGTQVIACDVSKYYDGIYTDSNNKPYLMHEPTLGIRYIFTIRPASECANAIDEGISRLNAGVTALQGGAKLADVKQNMFSLMERHGRVVVSISDKDNTLFSVRAELSALDYYYINSGSGLASCNTLKWYSYYEDNDGELWYREDALAEDGGKGVLNTYQTARIKRFYLSQLSGTYKKVRNNSSKTVTAAEGMRFHLVGTVGNGTTEKQFSHYELNFINAPAMSKTDLGSAANIKRTDEYLENHMTLQATVNFDDKIQYNNSSDLREPTSEALNLGVKPMQWDEAHYSFCYPTIDKYRRGTGSDYMGISPLHGDYMLLKSMNKSGVSSEGALANYSYHWWDSHEIYDYTAEKTSKASYGTFLYTDASDESRTIATLGFDAQLCVGSELYFTMEIADMTESGKVAPQVMAHVYAEDASGNRTRVISFMSSELSTAVAGTYEHGTWYQVYGHGIIPNEADVREAVPNAVRFVVDVDNYSRHTEGADYCVDELRFYTSNGKMKVKQTGGACEDENLSLTAYISAEQLEGKMSLSDSQAKTIYYRIFRKTGTDSNGKILYEAYPDASVYNNDSKDYGQVDIWKYDLNADGTLNGSNTHNAGYEFGTDGILYFKIVDNKVFDLEKGYEYFFSLTNDSGTPTSAVADWANPNDPCDVFSNFFVPRKTYITFANNNGGEADMTFAGTCSGGVSYDVDYNITVTVPDDAEVSGFMTVPDVKFDYFIGSADDLKLGGEYSGLVAALKAYRSHETDNSYTTTLTSGYGEVSDEQYAILQNAINNHVLLLSAAKNLEYTITATTSFVALPVQDSYTVGETDYDICDYFSFTFTVNGSGSSPVMVLGFPDVTYPENYKRVIRVGLEQLENMQKNSGNYILHIPVHSYSDKNGDTANNLVLYGKMTLLKENTTDPTVTANVADFATFENTVDSKPIVNATYQYIAVNLSGNSFQFHEGYQYNMFYQFYDAEDMEGSSPKTGSCEGSVEFLLKVVPQYVTWTGTDVSNRNWSNDGNWSRSVKADLYKTTTNNYVDDGENDSDASPEHGSNNLSGLTEVTAGNMATQPQTYVPMKFTYVTLLTGNVAPRLINLTAADNGIYSNIGDGATENIQYDMMVNYNTDSDGNHVASDCTHQVSGSAYDCEKFYSNVCKEIYFKPSAELINQHYLTYDKAWVEKELVAGKWYLMSTPLQATYAGDMYVPYNATTPALNGRQTTEAFKDITFYTEDTDNLGVVYSRTKYPIYQRSWGIGAIVYTKSIDVRHDEYQYQAKIKFPTVTTNLAEWSHTYNDVQVPYSEYTGFSIRAQRKDMKNGEDDVPALIRLPKADTSYDFYQWDNTKLDESHGAQSHDVFKEDNSYGQLLFDKHSSDQTVFEIGINSTQQQESIDTHYHLVGNPFMASIDMGKFFARNTDFARNYYTYEASTLETVNAETTPSVIRPMQAFFLKTGSEDPNLKIKFTPDMMVDGNHEVGTAVSNARAYAVPTLKLSATNGSTSSSATIGISEEASADYVATEDVETLFDSNLSNVPTVFTVAGSQAVSIDLRPSLDIIPFGVGCAASDELVEVSLTGTEAVGGQLYVFDAATGESTNIGEGSTVEVVPNEYGRYFLTYTRGTTALRDQLADGVRISVHNGTVSVTAAQSLGTVRALGLDGSLVYHQQHTGSSAAFSLPEGVYIIEADGPAGQRTTKILVK